MRALRVLPLGELRSVACSQHDLMAAQDEPRAQRLGNVSAAQNSDLHENLPGGAFARQRPPIYACMRVMPSRTRSSGDTQLNRSHPSKDSPNAIPGIATTS